MARRKKHDRRRNKNKNSGGEQDVQMEMTPMIDVVLQLIIFFMLVMDFSSRDLVPLKLAEAQRAKEEETQDKWTITVNVAHEKGIKCNNYRTARKGESGQWRTCKDLDHWFFHVRGEKYYLQSGAGRKGLDELQNDMIAYAEKRRGEEKVQGTKISEVPLVVRSDHRAPWGMAQQIMSLARHPEINIYKVKLAANIPRKDE